MKKPLLIGAILLYATAFAASLAIRASTPEGQTASDVSRLMSARVHEVIPVRSTSDIVKALEKARRNNLKIAISGARHSQGGQTFYPDAIVLDMKKYNRILNIDRANRTIRVQSGATWDDVQEAINPYGLAIRVMQSSNIFTIGGSISANAHGRDPREGPLIDTIDSFRLMRADGNVIQVSRTENAEWFPLVIGGYGLFGVVLDADIRLTADEMLEERTLKMGVERFPEYFAENVRDNPAVGLTIARLSTAPASFLKEMYVTNYVKATAPLPDNPPKLKEERAVELTKFLFGLSRKCDWGKNVSWTLQKRIFASENGTILSRNNAMRPEIEFLEYRDVQRTDLLQEYFILVNRFVPFIEGLGKIVRGSGLNLVNITVRYVPANTDATLSYAKEDSFALVLLFNHRRDSRGISQLERATQDMVDLALQQRGSYYLTYQLFPTPEQLNAAYPGAESFFQLKKKLDPDLFFMNEFYARYAP
jgi:FAD/FMN-containing dehydrogenase